LGKEVQKMTKLAAFDKGWRLLPAIAISYTVPIMTKTHKAHAGGGSPEQQTVMLMLESIAELIERSRIEITESLSIIARQIKREIPSDK
jgi:hypothetical protein